MKDIDDELKKSLKQLPEIPFGESLYWDILEAAYDNQTAARRDAKRTRSRKWFKPFAATFAGAAVAAIVIAGVLNGGVTHGKMKSTAAAVSARQIALKPADVSIVGTPQYIVTANGTPTILATVKNNSDQPVNKYDTFAVLWLGGSSSDPLSGDSLVLANGPGTPLPGRAATDDNGALGAHQTTLWQFNLDYASAARYVQHGVHLRFFQAGIPKSEMQPPMMTWNKVPLTAVFEGYNITANVPSTASSQGYERIRYTYQITNTGQRTVDLAKTWAIDWFNSPGLTKQKWDDPGVTRFTDIPNLADGQSPLIRPGEKRVIYFTWTISNSIHSIVNEQPKVFFVTEKATN